MMVNVTVIFIVISVVLVLLLGLSLWGLTKYRAKYKTANSQYKALYKTHKEFVVETETTITKLNNYVRNLQSAKDRAQAALDKYQTKKSSRIDKTGGKRL